MISQQFQMKILNLNHLIFAACVLWKESGRRAATGEKFSAKGFG